MRTEIKARPMRTVVISTHEGAEAYIVSTNAPEGIIRIQLQQHLDTLKRGEPIVRPFDFIKMCGYEIKVTLVEKRVCCIQNLFVDKAESVEAYYLCDLCY